MKNKTKHLSDVSLDFMGKDYAKEQAGASIQTSLVQDEEHNALPENASSENMFITGDNLEALKHLALTHYNKIKMIYIDPPYNTGNKKGFQYNDCFEFTKEDLITKLNYSEEDAKAFRKLYGKASHSAWLTFMYPRLKLARKLLSEDGVIFVSIDDNEQANLKLLMDDVFGEGNLIYQLSVVDKLNGNDNSSGMMETQEYCLIYAKAKYKFEIGVLPLEEDETKDWKVDNIGYWKEGGGIKATGVAARREDRPNLFFPLYLNEKTLEFSLKKSDYYFYELLPKIDGADGRWTWQRKKFIECANEVIIKKVNAGYSVYKKQRPQLGDLPSKRGKTTFYNSSYSTASSSAKIKDLFDGQKVFDFSKSIYLIKDFISLSNAKSNDLILDFFAGSATTAHAVMELNAEDGGNRKYIMVQLYEATDPAKAAYKAGYKSLDEISRERIKRAAKQIKENAGLLNKNMDLGFKHYRLVKSKE